MTRRTISWNKVVSPLFLTPLQDAWRSEAMPVSIEVSSWQR